jgi:hypothetical protein
MNVRSLFIETDNKHVEKTEAVYTDEEIMFTNSTCFLNHEEDISQSSANWKMLPRCIAEYRKTL